MTRPPLTAVEWEKLRAEYDESYGPLDRGISKISDCRCAHEETP